MTEPTGDSNERRRASRFRVSVSIELHDEHGFSLHSVSDLSVGGAYFDRSIPNPVGSKVRVSINLPGEPSIACEAEVVNVPNNQNFGMGLKFSNMSEPDSARLQAFTEKLNQPG